MGICCEFRRDKRKMKKKPIICQSEPDDEVQISELYDYSLPKTRKKVTRSSSMSFKNLKEKSTIQKCNTVAQLPIPKNIDRQNTVAPPNRKHHKHKYTNSQVN